MTSGKEYLHVKWALEAWEFLRKTEANSGGWKVSSGNVIQEKKKKKNLRLLSIYIPHLLPGLQALGYYILAS
jgi:hypothetical protein